MTNTMNAAAAKQILSALVATDLQGDSAECYSRCGDIRTALTYWRQVGERTGGSIGRAIDSLGYPAAVDLFVSESQAWARRQARWAKKNAKKAA